MKTKKEQKIIPLSLLASALASAITVPVASAEDTPGRFQPMEEVIVTARKRSESLQKVPLAVTALGAHELTVSGVSNIADIQAQVPGLTTYAARGSSSTLTTYIRGVGQPDPLWGVEPGVGLYIDDVYIARPQGALLEVFDVERIEVLRGPQGTLYGRNTIGGAIKYISAPITREPEGEFAIATGSYGRQDVTASFSAPIIKDTVYARGAIASLNRDGFGENRATGSDLSDKEILTGHFAIRWDANEDLTIKLAADATRDRSAPRGGQRMIENSFEPLLTAMLSGTVSDLSGISPLLSGIFPAASVAAASVNFPALPVSSDRYDLDNGFANQKNDNNTSGASLTLSYDINDHWNFKSVTAYREGDSDGGIDFDTGPLPIVDIDGTYTDHQFTQELQLNFDGDNLRAVVGLYSIDGTAGGNIHNRFMLPFTIPAGVAPNPMPFDVMVPATLYNSIAGDVVTTSYSLYGEASYQIDDRWSISFGGRYNWENKDATILSESFSDDSFAVVTGTETDFNGDETWKNFSPKIGIDFQVTPDIFAYGGVSRGFKSGGYNIRAKQTAVPESTKPYKEEVVTAYEVGIKTTLFNQLTVNATYFYSDYEDIQLSIFSQSSDGSFFGDFTNAGKGVIQGLEIEFRTAITANLAVSGNLTYLDADYKEYVDAGMDIADQQEFTNTPDLAGTINATYSHDFNNGGELVSRLSYSYRDDVIPTTDLSELIKQDTYDTINATVTYFSPSGDWRFVLEGRNLTDEEYRTTGYDLRNSGFPIVQGFYGDPRTFTLRATYLF